MKIQLVLYDLDNSDEVESLYKIIHKYFKNSPWPPSKEKLKSGGVKYYKAFLGDKQVGISGLIIKTPHLAETVKTAVFDEFQKQGIGRHLSEEIEEECKKLGIKKVMTTIYHFNHAMLTIKLKQGYTIEGYHSDHEAPGFHEYSLGKILI